MRWRERASGAATLGDDEPVDRRVMVPETRPLGDQAALALVDDALRVASRRELFTREEVHALLHQVGAAARDLPAGDRVLEIVDQADRDAGDQLMCSRADLVNPLLDIRLALVA